MASRALETARRARAGSPAAAEGRALARRRRRDRPRRRTRPPRRSRDADLWPVRDLYRTSSRSSRSATAPCATTPTRPRTCPASRPRSADMKNLQRCWMVKAILGNVPRGGRLLEIGAGEPLVAGMLSRLGYEVTVVDPYDGSGNGPREYSLLHRRLPRPRLRPRPVPARAGTRRRLRLRLLDLGARARPARRDRRGDRGGVARRSRSAAGRRSTRSTTCSPAGAPTRTARASSGSPPGSGSRPEALAATISAMETDPETYFVSAEAHNQWRGVGPVRPYPMRAIGSVELSRAAA